MNILTFLPLVLLYFTNSIIICNSAKILILIPFAAKSHHYFIHPIIKELAKRGHEITFYTSISMGENVTNIREVHLKDPLMELFGASGPDFQTARFLGKPRYITVPMMWFFGLGISYQVLMYPEIKELISSNEKYDLVLLETHFGQEALIAFGHKFQAPVISLQTFSTNYFTDEFVGNPFGISYIPNFEIPYSDKMTFLQRFHNTIITMITHLGSHLFYFRLQDFIMRRNFDYNGSESIPALTEMLQNVSLVIINSQISVDFPKPWVPNIIAVGGTHISPERQPLPKDLKKFMDGSKNGVIYFSFGTILPSEQMPEDMKTIFTKVFSKLKQNVLWKLPVDSFPGLPPNVRISKWVPQHDILGHPNCKAFINHGGLLSQEEAVYFGVPFIGMPFFGEQRVNVIRAADRGFAINLSLNNLTEESLSWALNEILYNPKYQENVKKYSRIFRDNPLPPIETAAYWIEYVLRHSGAPHLRSEGRKLPYYKYLFLDVMAFILVILLISLFISYKIINLILVKFYFNNKKDENKHRKKE